MWIFFSVTDIPWLATEAQLPKFYSTQCIGKTFRTYRSNTVNWVNLIFWPFVRREGNQAELTFAKTSKTVTRDGKKLANSWPVHLQ